MRRNFITLKVIALLIAGTLLFILSQRNPNKFSTEIRKCNDAASEIRFSCYRAAMEKYYTEDIEGFSKLLKNHKEISFENTFANDNNVTYAIFGTNCHTFYHAAGDFIATHAKNKSVVEKLLYGSNACTSGYMMGLYKRTALINNFSEEILRDFFEDCGRFGTHQCAHEIGHILHDKYTYSILKVLDDLAKKEYGYIANGDYQYATFVYQDLNAPFEDCRKLVPEEEYNYCYTGIGHNLFLFAEFSPGGYKNVFDECENKVNEENKENCYAFLIYRIGINEAAPRILSNKTAEGIKACEDAIKLSRIPSLKNHCYIGIGGGIGLYSDSELAGLEINDETKKNVIQRLNQFIGYCEQIGENQVGNCIRGLFGTPFRKYYENLKVNNERAEKILQEINKDFQVVG